MFLEFFHCPVLSCTDPSQCLWISSADFLHPWSVPCSFISVLTASLLPSQSLPAWTLILPQLPRLLSLMLKSGGSFHDSLTLEFCMYSKLWTSKSSARPCGDLFDTDCCCDGTLSTWVAECDEINTREVPRHLSVHKAHWRQSISM